MLKTLNIPSTIAVMQHPDDGWTLLTLLLPWGCLFPQIYLTKKMNPAEVVQRLQTSLPSGIRLGSAKELRVFREDGSNAENMAALIEDLEYIVAVRASRCPSFHLLELHALCRRGMIPINYRCWQHSES